MKKLILALLILVACDNSDEPKPTVEGTPCDGSDPSKIVGAVCNNGFETDNPAHCGSRSNGGIAHYLCRN